MADDEYMTVAEFGGTRDGSCPGLTVAQVMTVWEGADQGLVRWIPAMRSQPSHIRRYHRGDVRELLEATAVSGG